jgi:hypothetical protein
LPVNGSLFDLPEPAPAFDGVTFDQDRDGSRLNAQLSRVLAVLKGGCWHTLADVAARTGDPEASVSARIRDLRKPRFGGYVVERRYVERGLWEYRLAEAHDTFAEVTDAAL